MSVTLLCDRFSLDTYGLNGALLLMAGMSLNICVCGMLFRPPQFYMQRYMRRQNRKKTAAKETEKINKLAVDDANKPETDANISSNQDAGANPVDSTDALQEVQLSDYLETEDAKNKQKVLSTPHVAGGNSKCVVADKSETCFVNEAFSACDVSENNNAAVTWTDVQLLAGEEGRVSFVDVKFPSTNHILKNGETKSETKPHSPLWCYNSFCEWITCGGSKKSIRHESKSKTTDMYRFVTNPAVLLYATVAAVSNR